MKPICLQQGTRRVCVRVCGIVLLNLLLSCFTTYAQIVNLDLKNVPLETACKEIEKQTGYNFVYPSNLKKNECQVSIRLENEDVKTAISKVFEGTPFGYKVVNKVVAVNTVNTKSKTVLKENRDSINITGTVIGTDATTGLPNATVRSAYTKKVALTNQKGEFTLKGVMIGEEIQVSYVGYTTQKLNLLDMSRRSYYFVLKPADNELDKVVVQAYSTTNKRLNTGSITSISGKEIENQPVSNPLAALAGRVPGMVVSPTSGNEAAPIRIEIRGRNNINQNFASAPMIIIDGIPSSVLDLYGGANGDTKMAYISQGLNQAQTGISTSPLFGINPRDIASIDVLKDADATAIYGSRGANGVIIINTKRGTSGVPSVDVNVSEGLTIVTRYPKLLNTTDYLQLRREAFKNDGLVPSANPSSPNYAPDLMVWDTTRYTDWNKEIFGHVGTRTTAAVSLNGGAADTRYRLSANYVKQKAIDNYSGGNKSGNIRLNLNTSAFNQKLHFNTNISIGVTDVDQVNLPNASLLAPNAPPMLKADGSFNREEYYAAYGANITKAYPFEDLNVHASNKGFNVNAGFQVSYQLAKGLLLSANAGLQKNTSNSRGITPPAENLGYVNITNSLGISSWGQTNNQVLNVEPLLNYDRVVGQGTLSVVAGGTFNTVKTASNVLKGLNYKDADLMSSITNAPTVTGDDRSAEYKYIGAFARINYIYANRYSINLSARRDGSSRFGPDHRYGNFGAVGAAWIFSDEPWLAKALPKAVTMLKLRSSYGITGSDAIGEYQYLSQWGATSNGSKSYGYQDVPQLMAQWQANSQFHWPAKKSLDIAFESAFFDSRASLNINWYRNTCGDQLLIYATGAYTGFTSVVTNLPANVMNRGTEIALSLTPVRRKDLSWNISFNTSFTRNVLLSYPDIENSNYKSSYLVGGSLDDTYLLHFLGVDPATGLPKYEDFNKDGKTTVTYSAGTPGADDRRIVRSTLPKFYGGFNTSFQLKGWSIGGNFDFKRFYARSAEGVSRIGNMANTSYDLFNDRWKGVGDVSKGARPTTRISDEISYYVDSDAGMKLINMLKMQSIYLSYNLKDEICRSMHVQHLSFDISGNNLFKITNYKGLDPEYANYYSPLTRTVVFGIKCTL
ncbi:TonB-linked outer membrane protein, SusC/RagA family [Chitinophaga jiangningensis]|uniref:TonB-linked outer membrane protein, SusC/RagA family n=1 Tax=Chitinophaga jiangningensis TaxID=1419482 RepID=A0A1M6V9B1_9BACT|nr:SusC/RagA family TonB-linked outer membrane protein [Chitinophaga jiangningensis]SHK77971.1 TonB-linked outer membrane protein, SusC/RagA family [Chitinophaga jiangningensis]